MRWLRSLLARFHLPSNGTAHIRERAEQKREDAWKMRPAVERQAPGVANLPADEFATRFLQAFGQRP